MGILNFGLVSGTHHSTSSEHDVIKSLVPTKLQYRSNLEIPDEILRDLHILF